MFYWYWEGRGVSPQHRSETEADGALAHSWVVGKTAGHWAEEEAAAYA